jgi:hypothetical protein
MSRCFGSWLMFAAGVFTLAAPHVLAETNGKLLCEITENGLAASGVVSVQVGGKEIASASCGRELSLPPGEYVAALRLDGALDGPEQRQPLSVKPGELSHPRADFTTGTIEVRIASQGRRAAGMAIIKRKNQQLGTLGSGVAAHLTSGVYHIVVRYRAHEKDLGDVTLAPGQQVVLDAAFE